MVKARGVPEFEWDTLQAIYNIGLVGTSQQIQEEIGVQKTEESAQEPSAYKGFDPYVRYMQNPSGYFKSGVNELIRKGYVVKRNSNYYLTEDGIKFYEERV